MSQYRSTSRSVVTLVLVALTILSGCATRTRVPQRSTGRLAASEQIHKGSDLPSHVRVVYTFLMAWGKENWAEARMVAAEQVWVRMGDKVWALDLSAGQAEVALIFPFRRISTARVGGEVKGVILDEIGLKVGEVEKRGPGTITLEGKEGEYRVTAVSIP